MRFKTFWINQAFKNFGMLLTALSLPRSGSSLREAGQ